MGGKMWKSIVKWPCPDVNMGNTNNISTDMHATEEGALLVCRALEREGLGGMGKIFPIETKVVKED